MEKAIEHLLAIIREMETEGVVSGVTYQRDPRANVEFAGRVISDNEPTVLVVAVTDWDFDSRNGRRREVGRIMVQFLIRATELAPTDFERQQTEGLRRCQGAATALMSALFRDAEWKVREEVVQTRTVFDQYDTNLIGLAMSFTIVERQGECLASVMV